MSSFEDDKIMVGYQPRKVRQRTM